MDAAIDEAMQCDRTDGNAAHSRSASFGGVAAPPSDWGAESALVASGAAVQQVYAAVDMRHCSRSAQPWWSEAAGSAQAADWLDQPRVAKHPRISGGALQSPRNAAWYAKLSVSAEQLSSSSVHEHFQTTCGLPVATCPSAYSRGPNIGSAESLCCWVDPAVLCT